MSDLSKKKPKVLTVGEIADLSQDIEKSINNVIIALDGLPLASAKRVVQTAIEIIENYVQIKIQY